LLVKHPTSFLATAGRPAICIVGAGAAGLTLAAELDGSDVAVWVLDAGQRHASVGPADDYRGKANRPHPDPADYRRFGLGGTTGVWGGRCVPFDPIDFEARAHVTDSGWPISYAEVARYYPRAMAHCDAGAFDFSVTGSLPGASPTVADWPGDDAVLADRIERYSLPTDFGAKYRRALEKSSNVTVLLDTRCVRIDAAGGDGVVTSLEVVCGDGHRHRIFAGRFVLAIGGIEVPRLLLASDPNGPGLGNHGDRVGRHYTCHFESLAARFVPNGSRIAFDFERTADGAYCRRKFQLSDAVQRQNRLLNCTFRLHFPNYGDASHGSAVMSSIFLAKSMLVPEYRQILGSYADGTPDSSASEHLRNVMSGIPELARFSVRWLLERQLARRKLPYTLVPNADGSYPVEFNSEQTPLHASRVSLGTQVDRHGLRRPIVDWRLHPADLDAASRAFNILREEIHRSTPCRVEFDEQGLRATLDRSVPVGGHHIGTTRMAASPTKGVVDTDCAVFGLRNLFVASSAVFPTSSHANPTLTIVALAVRLADYLKRSEATSLPR
jgi:hypothetical protein